MGPDRASPPFRQSLLAAIATDGRAAVTTVSGGADPGELFDRRDARGDLADAVLPHRLHPLADGRALDLLARRLLGGELLEALAHREQLEDSDAAAIAGLAATGA